MGAPLNGGTAADMVTSTEDGFRRYRVDVGQTGFFEGRYAIAWEERH